MKYSFFSITALLFAVSFLSGCGNTSAPAEAAQAAEASAQKEHPGLHLSAEQVRTAGIRWSAPQQRTAAQALAVSGELRVHNESIATVSAFSDGIVTSLRTGLNKSVAKGEILAVIRKPDLVDIQQDYLETRDRLVFLETEYERYKSLRDDNATALKNFQKAEADRREAHTRLQLLAAKLALYHIDAANLTPDKVRTEITLTAPFAGTVTRTFVTPGSAVQMGSPVCEVLDVSQLHTDIFIFEKDLSLVRKGQTVLLDLPGGSVQSAEIFSIDPSLDPERKAVRAHARLKGAASATLVNGAYVQGRILYGEQSALQPALPADAVVQEEDGAYIFLFEKDGGDKVFFKKIRVKTLPAKDGYLIVQPEQALPEGVQVVTQGAYYVAAQSRVEEFAEE
ncbi:MAG: efflux RND transporter periplasmic adaptor subunit [Saprospiraceae bacterium]|nr:efflux RND transporter periplasmic adaptor subunit [Saprospiraceae bacterium]